MSKGPAITVSYSNSRIHVASHDGEGMIFDDLPEIMLRLFKAYLNRDNSCAEQLSLKHFTPFTQEVLRALQKIPFGQTVTYQQIAQQIGRPNAARAVGTACGRNPYLILIPCHRVVGGQGLGGFAAGLEVKKKLLEYELGTSLASSLGAYRRCQNDRCRDSKENR